MGDYKMRAGGGGGYKLDLFRETTGRKRSDRRAGPNDGLEIRLHPPASSTIGSRGVVGNEPGAAPRDGHDASEPVYRGKHSEPSFF